MHVGWWIARPSSVLNSRPDPRRRATSRLPSCLWPPLPLPRPRPLAPSPPPAPQFYLTLAPTPWLDGKHTIFGRVASGMGTLKKLGLVPVDGNDRPLTEVRATPSGSRRDSSRGRGRARSFRRMPERPPPALTPPKSDDRRPPRNPPEVVVHRAYPASSPEIPLPGGGGPGGVGMLTMGGAPQHGGYLTQQ